MATFRETLQARQAQMDRALGVTPPTPTPPAVQQAQQVAQARFNESVGQRRARERDALERGLAGLLGRADAGIPVSPDVRAAYLEAFRVQERLDATEQHQTRVERLLFDPEQGTLQTAPLREAHSAESTTPNSDKQQRLDALLGVDRRR